MRFENSYGKGDTDMQVDAFGYAKSDEWSDWLSVADPSEVSAFYQGVAAGLSSEVPDEPVLADPADQPLDALYRKGKSKGKGKNTFKGKGKGFGKVTASSSSRAATKAVLAKVTGNNSNSRDPVAGVETARPTCTAAGATSRATWRATAASARLVSLASLGLHLGPPTQSSRASRSTLTTPSKWATRAWAA